jgi:hypothetical protein
MTTTQCKFDVFVSYNSDDRAIALALSKLLRERGLRVWLDIWELRPGLTWQDGIVDALATSCSCAILLGEGGYGPWHKKEMQLALASQGAEFPVIPVLLPTQKVERDSSSHSPNGALRSEIPAFLHLLTWVDLREGLHDREGLDRLVWGISGQRPTRPAEVATHPSASANATQESRYKITSPTNGDLVFASSRVIGLGPPNEVVFLHCRAQDDDRFHIHTMTRTDGAGRWSCPFGRLEFHSMRYGTYELYAAGVLDKQGDRPVTHCPKRTCSR